jgi:hypothetical protein
MRDLKNSNQVIELITEFDIFIKAFDQIRPFSARKVETHLETLKLVRAASKPTNVLDNDLWFQKLLPTLEAWGMDARGATLLNLSTVRSSFISLRPQLVEIQDYRLIDIPISRVFSIGRQIWNIVNKLEVGAQATRLVANSKALHHLFPDLIPPIDRKYTISFFYGRPEALQAKTQQDKFEDMWPAFHKIASNTAEISQKYIGQYMHTSIPKIIDNAIVGYVSIHKLAKIDV